MLEVRAEVQPNVAERWREDAASRRLPAGAREAGVVDRLVENTGLEGPAIVLLVVGEESNAETAVVVERIVERRPLQERRVLGAGHRFEARKRVEIAYLKRDRRPIHVIGEPNV